VEQVVRDEKRKSKLVRRDVCFVEVEVTSYRPSDCPMAAWYRQLFQIAAGGDLLFGARFFDDPRDFLSTNNHSGHIHQVDKQFGRESHEAWTVPECGWGAGTSSRRSSPTRGPQTPELQLGR
jgi:hypothetical protein